jgi:hypothetical protein
MLDRIASMQGGGSGIHRLAAVVFAALRFRGLTGRRSRLHFKPLLAWTESVAWRILGQLVVINKMARRWAFLNPSRTD